MPRIVESQPIESSLRFSLALAGTGGKIVKAALAAFLRSTSPTDMLRRLPCPKALPGVASRVRTVLSGDRGLSRSTAVSGGSLFVAPLPLTFASLSRGSNLDVSGVAWTGANWEEVGIASDASETAGEEVSVGIGGTGGSICTICRDGEDVVFCKGCEFD